MKIILFGHQNWGIEAIKTITNLNHELLFVYTHPLDMDKHEKIWYDSLSVECNKLKIPFEERSSLNENDIKKIKKLNPDIIFSMGWRRLLPSSIFEIPKYGTINFHDGLIPDYKGFAPINWAIINGEKEIGLTAHYIDATADTGDILLQNKISVEKNDTAHDAYKKLLNFTKPMLKNILENITDNSLTPISQKTLLPGFFCSRRFPHDGKINWNENRFRIHNLIRGLSDPFPNAFFYFENTKIFVKHSKLIDIDFRGTPGRICSINSDGIIVTCGNNTQENQALLITKIQILK